MNMELTVHRVTERAALCELNVFHGSWCPTEEERAMPGRVDRHQRLVRLERPMSN